VLSDGCWITRPSTREAAIAGDEIRD
jgi:hypothetical protein